ncbi:MAG: hypothetical protein R3B54_02025 [Bdellovibrionota bacterium]
MRRRFVVMLKNIALLAIAVFSIFSAPAEAGIRSWFASLCGYSTAEEAGEEPANPIPDFLKASFAEVAKLDTSKALAAATAIYPEFDPTHGPRYGNPTPERVTAWKGLLALVQLKEEDGSSTYDTYLDGVGEAELMDGDDVNLYLNWLAAAGVYLRALGKDTTLLFRHAFALGLDHLSFVRSLPPDVALLYIQGDPNYTDASVETYLEDLTETYRRWGEVFRELMERRAAREAAQRATAQPQPEAAAEPQR